MSEIRSNGEAVEKSPQMSLEEFKAFFRDNENSLPEILEINSLYVQGGLGEYFDVDFDLDPRELKESEFYEHIDPELPTIIIDVNSTYAGSELLGIVSHEDEARMNIIYAPTVGPSLRINTDHRTGVSRLEVSSGSIVLPNGQVSYGKFPQVVVADALETTDLSLLEQCREYGIKTFHSPESITYYDDKSNLGELVKNDIVRVPKHLARAAFLDSKDVDGLVIKPSNRLGGLGVRLTDFGAEPGKTKQYYKFLEEHGYEPIVQERIRSFHITDPETGKRLDWNVRAILSYGDLIDMYVRADNWGGPVNKSVSAQTISMSDFSKYFKNSEDAQYVIARLKEAAQITAVENPRSVIGADFTVDEDMDVYTFELNDGYVGGVQTIAKLEETYDGKLAMSRTMIKKFKDQIPHVDRNKVPAEYSDIHSLDASYTAYFNALRVSRYSEKIGKIDPDDISLSSYEYWAMSATLMLVGSDAHNHKNMDVERRAMERLRKMYPLEVRSQLDYLYYYSSERKTWKKYLDQYLSVVDGSDLEILKRRTDIAALEFDLPKFKELHQRQVREFGRSAYRAYWTSSKSILKEFGSISKALHEGDAREFKDLMEGVIAAYCEYDYKVADELIMRKIEKSGYGNEYSVALQYLRMRLAMSDGRADDAVTRVRQYDIERKSLPVKDVKVVNVASAD